MDECQPSEAMDLASAQATQKTALERFPAYYAKLLSNCEGAFLFPWPPSNLSPSLGSPYRLTQVFTALWIAAIRQKP